MNFNMFYDFSFDLGKRFVKLFEVCHNEITEETYYTKYQLVPGSAGSNYFSCCLIA